MSRKEVFFDYDRLWELYAIRFPDGWWHDWFGCEHVVLGGSPDRRDQWNLWRGSHGEGDAGGSLAPVVSSGHPDCALGFAMDGHTWSAF